MINYNYFNDDRKTDVRFYESDAQDVRLNKEIHHLENGIKDDFSLINNGLINVGLFSLLYSGSVYSNGFPFPPNNELDIVTALFGAGLLAGLAKIASGVYNVRKRDRKITQFKAELEQILETDLTKECD